MVTHSLQGRSSNLLRPVKESIGSFCGSLAHAPKARFTDRLPIPENRQGCSDHAPSYTVLVPSKSEGEGVLTWGGGEGGVLNAGF